MAYVYVINAFIITWLLVDFIEWLSRDPGQEEFEYHCARTWDPNHQLDARFEKRAKR